MKTRLLNAYAELMCRAIWAARRVFPSANGESEHSMLHRDFEWSGWHYCEVCRRGAKHRFIAWADEDVTTTECPLCGLEATL